MVAFHTRNPTFDSYGGDAEVEVGNYDLQHYSAAVNLPLDNMFAVRWRVTTTIKAKAIMTRPARSGQDYQRAREAVVEPNDAFSLLVGTSYGKMRPFRAATRSPPPAGAGSDGGVRRHISRPQGAAGGLGRSQLGAWAGQGHLLASVS